MGGGRKEDSSKELQQKDLESEIIRKTQKKIANILLAESDEQFGLDMILFSINQDHNNQKNYNILFGIAMY